MNGSVVRSLKPILIILFGLLAAPAAARPAPDSFADLADKLLPTVVNISTSQTLKAANPKLSLPDIPPGSPLEDLFKDFLQNNRALPRHVTSLGSGFIIDPAGYVITNNHVIADADQITVTLNDGTSLPAKLVGRDEKTDLALLKVKPAKPLPATKLGDSDHARVGDWVIAIGNPFGLGSTVTAGIVSARNRDINAGPYDDFIQTDAPINRGNSGGPLFDMDGNVVGVNSAIFSPTGGSVGIGFSIPSNLVKDIVDQLKKYGAARRGWVGVSIQQITPEIAQAMGLPSSAGALVSGVDTNGPAAKAGLKNGDVILAFDNKPILDNRALPRIVADTPAGKTVSVQLLRGGKKQNVKLTVAKLQDQGKRKPQAKPASPPPPKPKSKIAQLGLSLATLDQEMRSQYKIPVEVHGVLVTDVDPEGAAADKNLRPGDIIVEVQNQAVRTPDDIAKKVEADAKSGRKLEMFLINRGGQMTFIALPLAGG
ncbi:MAG TPA: DegQ family serine endoprotease [Rhizomicrobium sp.]|nr:DegQ family serine endoprotease [Rhizomicrobium sp.]